MEYVKFKVLRDVYEEMFVSREYEYLGISDLVFKGSLGRIDLRFIFRVILYLFE